MVSKIILIKVGVVVSYIYWCIKMGGTLQK